MKNLRRHASPPLEWEDDPQLHDVAIRIRMQSTYPLGPMTCDVPLSSAPRKTDRHGLIMGSSKDICSLFDSYLPNHEASTHEITCGMFSTQLRSSSKKNQIKRSSYVTVMPFTNQVVFSSREFRLPEKLEMANLLSDEPMTNSIMPKVKMFEAEQRRLFSQFEVREFCDNLVEGVVKALKEVSKIQKKSTTTRAPVAKPSLFINEKPKGKSENNLEDLKDFSDSLPIFDEYDEELIESLMICEDNCDLPFPEPDFMFDKEQTIAELIFLQPEHPNSVFENMFRSFKVFEPDELLDQKRFQHDNGINSGFVLSFDQFLKHSKGFDHFKESLELDLQQPDFCARNSFDSFLFKENSFNLSCYRYALITGNLFASTCALDEFMVKNLLEQKSLRAKTDFCCDSVLKSDLELLYSNSDHVSDDPWISNSRFEIDLVCSKSEKLAPVLNLFFSNCAITCPDTILVYNTYFDRLHDDLKLSWINKISLQEVSGTEAEIVLISLRFGDGKNYLDNVLNSITELLEEESDQTKFICDSYAIYKSSDLQFSRIQTTREVGND
ncbi:hypothetical protein DY000_02022393 [Brassica cretica]|uniref:Uncharacterized protein n=1 Tax=Brassica cretica TaxID=69181 RepID=A0ABQ7EAA0_BRACR|nr:hypothetical protein DY000_02022393 [Brassica cretica]